MPEPQGTTQALVRRPPSMPTANERNNLGQLANWLAKSGYFRDAQGGLQAFAKLMFGRDLGLSATAALTGIHIVEGKPEISANIQAQMVRTYVGPEGERYDFKRLEHTNEKCRIEFFRRRLGEEWESLGVEEYTIEDAERAELTSPTRNGKPSNYTKFPRNMLFARCMSNGTAFLCPEVTDGIRVYSEGEIGRQVPQENGNGHVAHVDLSTDSIEEAEVVDGEPVAEEVAQAQDQAAEQPEEAAEEPQEAAGDDPIPAVEERVHKAWLDAGVSERDALQKVVMCNHNPQALEVSMQAAVRTAKQKARVAK